MDNQHKTIYGIGVSTGTASAPVVKVAPAPGVDPTESPSTDAAADGARVREAMAAVAAGLKQQAETAPEKARPILEASAQLASDRALAKAVDKKLKAGSGITQSVHDAVADYAALLAGLGGYMAERVTDLYDVRDRTICELRGLPKPGVPFVSEPTILLADAAASRNCRARSLGDRGYCHRCGWRHQPHRNFGGAIGYPRRSQSRRNHGSRHWYYRCHRRWCRRGHR